MLQCDFSGNIKYYSVILALSLLLMPSLGNSASFLEIAENVVKNDPDVRAAGKEVELSRISAMKSKSTYLPNLSGNVKGGVTADDYEDSSNDYGEVSVSLNLTQDIINYSKYYDIKGAEQRIKTAESNLVNARRKVLLELGLSWAAYWKAAGQITINGDNLKILDRYRRNSQERYDAGELTVTDVRLAKTRYQAALSQKSRFLRELFRSRKTLGEIIKMPVPDNVVLYEMSMEKIPFPEPAAAVNGHPAVQPLIDELAAVEFDIKRQRAGHLPTLELVSSYEYQFEGEHDSDRYPHTEGNLGLEVNIPIYSGGSVTHGVSAAIREKQRLQIRLAQLKDEIIRDMESDKYELEQNLAEIEISRRQMEYAEETLDGMNEEYELGTRTSTDVFLSQADMINSRLEMIVVREERAGLLMRYLYSIGKLNLQTLRKLTD